MANILASPRYVQKICDAKPTHDKELFWVHGKTRSWDGYTYFQKQPTGSQASAVTSQFPNPKEAKLPKFRKH
jgi:hypothetical protein